MIVSLAMTTYNGEKYIIKQLETLRNQSRKIDEVVICDDGSTDRTPELVRDYIKKHSLDNWTYLINEHNFGFIENFRHAISLTHGDIVFLADQDDEWELNKIEVMTELLEKRDDIDCLMTSVRLIDQNSEPINPEGYKKWYARMIESEQGSLLNVDFMELCCENFAPGCTICFRRIIADEYVVMDNHDKVFHDWLICVLAARKNKLWMLFTPLINYRIHSNNALGMAVTKEQAKAARAKKTRETELNLIRNLKKRVELGIGQPYKNQKMLENNVRYIDARINLYTEKKFGNLVKVLLKSANAHNVTRSRLRTDCKDILFWLGLIYK